MLMPIALNIALKINIVEKRAAFNGDTISTTISGGY